MSPTTTRNHYSLLWLHQGTSNIQEKANHRQHNFWTIIILKIKNFGNDEFRCVWGKFEFWKFRFGKFWTAGGLESWNVALKPWHLEISKSWIFDMIKPQKKNMLKTETLTIWNKFEALNWIIHKSIDYQWSVVHGSWLKAHVSCLNARGQEKMALGPGAWRAQRHIVLGDEPWAMRHEPFIID